MIKGILIFENGDIQQIGDLSSLAVIINTMRAILPDLEMKEKQRILQQISVEDLKKYLEEQLTIEEP